MNLLRKTAGIILYRLILILVKIIPSSKGDKHLLLIKTDEIGDYILFRNLFQHLRQSEKFKNYKITLIGTSSWEKLFDHYDKSYIDNTIWLNKKRFKSDLLYRFKILHQVRKLAVSDVINCVFSRSLNIDDGFAFVSAAKYKIAMISDIANRTNGSINLDSFIYTNLIDAGDNRVFDTIRSSEFIKSILSLNEIPYSTRLPLDDVNIAPVSNYYILFIGAGNSERQWPINHFVKVAEYVLSLQPECVPIICGGKEDEQMSNQFVSSFKGNVYNFVGKTSLDELVKLSSKATFLLSVDTGALHIGVASGTKVIGLFSGKFYGRFGPYPRNITTFCWCIYPDFADKLISDNNDVLYDTTIMKNDTIKMIPPEKVLPYINKALSR